MKQIVITLLLISILSACLPADKDTLPTPPVIESTQTIESTSEAESASWWREAVFYEIFVRSFNDSDGDGIGDFNGITQKLDYLESLGVNAIWLMPINPSPAYHGYHITNFYAVDPEYGTKDDFKHLLDEAHKKNIRIIMDFVVNHTSTSHPFFVDANSSPDSKYRDWYIWADTTHGNKWHEGNGGYYFAYFSGEIPDLNYRNPEVTAQTYKVSQYWLEDVGIDGLRVDAAKHLIEEGDKLENTQSTHDWFKEYYSSQKSSHPEAFMLGEVFGAGAFIATTYEGQFDQIFNFEIASGIMNSVNGESNTSINGTWNFTLKDITDGNYATFLTNHDQNRVMSVFNGNEQKAKLAATLLFTSPGTPFIYYGEEIGMQGKKPDEDIRLPMQWNASPNAGFTTGTPWRKPFENFEAVNVAKQEADPNSLLNLYRTLIQLRKSHPALQSGSSISVLHTGNPGIFAFIRTDGNEQFLILVNLKKTPITEYSLSMTESVLSNGILTLSSMLENVQAENVVIENGMFKNFKPLDEIPAYQAYIFSLK